MLINFALQFGGPNILMPEQVLFEPSQSSPGQQSAAAVSSEAKSIIDSLPCLNFLRCPELKMST